jgi:hypothetical protein
VTKRRLQSYIDALADGKRPDSFDAEQEDVAALRTAINLRSARPGEMLPDDEFVDRLHEELAAQADPRVVPMARQAKYRRHRTTIAAIAAGLVLVGGTAAVTETVDQGTVSPAALAAPHGSSLRTGTFESAGGQVMGQIVVSRGNPSWVYLDVAGAKYTGTIVCKLQVEDGATVATGAFVLNGGRGVFTKDVHVDIDQLRGAKLVTPSGAVVASATLA